MPPSAAWIGGPFGHGDVDSRVVLVAAADRARAEAGDDRAVDRPDQRPGARPGSARLASGVEPVDAELGGDLALDRGHRAVELFFVFADPLRAPLAVCAAAATSACWRPCSACRALAKARSSAAIASRAASIRSLAPRRRTTMPLTWSRSVRTRPTTASSIACKRSRYSARAARSSKSLEPTMQADQVRACRSHRSRPAARASACSARRRWERTLLSRASWRRRARRPPRRVRPAWRRAGRSTAGLLGADRARPRRVSRVDLVLVVGDRRRQHALAFLHFGQLGLLGFELGLEVLRPARPGLASEQRERAPRRRQRPPPRRGDS